MASTYLTRTPASAGNRKTFTISVWIKRGDLGRQQHFASGSGTEIRFTSADKTLFRDGGANYGLSDAVFRDVSAWYHIVYAIDTTQATESNRIKLYVNGEQFTVTTFPTQNYDFNWNNNVEHQIGASGGTEFFDGSMSHFHNIDGTAYDASAFGQADANGVWTIKTSPSVTYGTNGFFVLKDGNSVTDQSGNGNNFTVAGGTLTNTEDCPSNVFCTLNPLIPSNGSFSEGNNTVTTSTSTWCTVGSNLGVTSGKYYWEVKMNLLSGSTTSFYTMIGFARLQGNSSDLGNNLTSNLGDNNGVGIYSDNGYLYHLTTNSPYTSSFKTSGNIIGVALDLDNNYAYWSINGTWQNSGDPTSGATGTGGYDLSSFADGSFIVPASSVQNYASANQSENEYNFGNGYFGTTPVASAGTNASGIGIFEYDVPTGYTALSTKGLNL